MKPHAARLKTIDTRRVRPRHDVQTVDPELRSKQHRAWSNAVMRRDGYACQDPDHDPRYPRQGVRLHADHIRERRDDPALMFDRENGMTRCVRCHVLKTNRERAKRAVT